MASGNARLGETQARINISRRNINDFRYTDGTTLMAKIEEEQKSLSKKVNEWKAGLKLNIQKTNIMAFGPITSRQTDGETMETVTDFLFLGFRNHCTHEIKWRLLLGRKSVLKSVLKSRDIALPTKVCLVKAMVFPVVMYGYDICTIKKAQHWRINAFELWCWRRLLRVPWTARRSNQSILKEINSEYSLEGLMLYSGQVTWRVNSWKRPWC